MIKIAGIVLLLIMSALTGCFAAEGLKKRVKALRQIRIMLETLRLMIRYEALEVSEIARRLSEDPKLSDLKFLSPLHEYTEEYLHSGGMTFFEAWDRAVSENSEYLLAEDISLLRRVGGSLGTCDCDGQIAALSLCCAEADRLTADAEEQYKAKGRLYRSLGAIAGALIAVIAV